MPSPAQAHYQRVTAQRESCAYADDTLVHATGYELMLAKLAADKRRLKSVQSIELRADIKRELLPEYVPYIEGVLASDGGVQDDVLMSVMVWRIDSGDGAGALDIARYALEHGLTLPDQYQRSTATLIAEEFADSAKRARDGNQGFEIAQLHAVAELTEPHDMPDEVRAKLYKELGLLTQNPGEALGLLQRAMQLNDKVGVKKDIEKLERELKNAAQAQSNAPA